MSDLRFYVISNSISVQFEPKTNFRIIGEKKKRIFDQKSQFSEISPKLDCNPQIYTRFTEKETIMRKTDS